ncbi:MAG: signal peptidase I [Crocinitomicaceae bacterium]
MGYLGLLIGYLIILLTPIVGMWNKRFKDLGLNPTHAFIPFLNYFQLLKACKLPKYWVIFLIFPGVQFYMWASLNVTYIRKFGEFGIKETIMGILFPYPVFINIAKKPEQYKVAEATNWDVAKQVDARTPSDHVALFFALPIVGHVLAVPFSMLGFKRKPGKKSIIKEWGDAFVFALIAAAVIRTYVFEPYKIPTGSMEKTLLVGDQLFVDKITYGPRVPMTPFSFPIFHNMIPYLNINSYSTVQTIPYTRVPGFRGVDRNDVVVFNFPAGDTAIMDPRMPYGLIGHNYYEILRNVSFHNCCIREGHDIAFFEDNYNYYLNKTRKEFEDGKVYSYRVDQEDYDRGYVACGGLVTRPVDKKENYIKRCVAIPGDEIKIINQVLFVNGEEAYKPEHMQKNPVPTPFGAYQPEKSLADFNEYVKDPYVRMRTPISYYPIFPNDSQYNWTEDNFGPLRIPKKGDVVELTKLNIPIYRRIITAFEGHTLEEKEDGFYIDGKKTEKYTVQMNYYWMMGDNRNGSADSRFWGFVPEDHIVGHAAFTWLSVDQQKGMFGGGMRWKRMFNKIK